MAKRDYTELLTINGVTLWTDDATGIVVSDIAAFEQYMDEPYTGL